MTIPYIHDFNNEITHHFENYEKFQKLVFSCILKKDIFMN